MNLVEKKSTGIIIREFRISDYEKLITLWDVSCLPYKPQGRDSRANIQWQIEQPNTMYLIADFNGTMVGAVFGTNDGRKGWINRLAVHPEYQRQGVARQLVEAVERRLSSIGIDIVACLVEDWNHDSIQVFEKLGYTKHRDVLYFSKRKGEHI